MDLARSEQHRLKVMMLMRIATLKKRLFELYSPIEADYWLKSPSMMLDGHRPIDLVSNSLGYLEVDNIIDLMLDGVYL